MSITSTAEKRQKMGKKPDETLKQRIIDGAWDLFYEKGYANTTLNDILAKVNTSKGGFYYYFKKKDDLLNSLYVIFDREYEKFYTNLDKSQNAILQLELVSQYVCFFIDANVSYELLTELYISQLDRRKQEAFLSPDRYYFRMVKEIIETGQQRGEIRDDIDAFSLAQHILLLERGILINWCVRGGSYSLGAKGHEDFKLYIAFLRPEMAGKEQ